MYQSFKGEAAEWIALRFRTALRALESLAVRARDPHESAAAIVTDWAMATNFGAREWNYNFGLSREDLSPYFFKVASGTKYPAFVSDDEGGRAWIDWLKTQRTEAFNKLLTDPEALDWFGSMSGWPRDPAYQTARKRVDAVLFEPEPPKKVQGEEPRVRVEPREGVGESEEPLDIDPPRAAEVVS